jgi:hypothetical protein
LPGLRLFAIETTFGALTFAQRALWAAAIFLQVDTDIIRRGPVPPNCETIDTNPFKGRH